MLEKHRTYGTDGTYGTYKSHRSYKSYRSYTFRRGRALIPQVARRSTGKKGPGRPEAALAANRLGLERIRSVGGRRRTLSCVSRSGSISAASNEEVSTVAPTGGFGGRTIGTSGAATIASGAAGGDRRDRSRIAGGPAGLGNRGGRLRRGWLGRGLLLHQAAHRPIADDPRLRWGGLSRFSSHENGTVPFCRHGLVESDRRGPARRESPRRFSNGEAACQSPPAGAGEPEPSAAPDAGDAGGGQRLASADHLPDDRVADRVEPDTDAHRQQHCQRTWQPRHGSLAPRIAVDYRPTKPYTMPDGGKPPTACRPQIDGPPPERFAWEDFSAGFQFGRHTPCAVRNGARPVPALIMRHPRP